MREKYILQCDQICEQRRATTTTEKVIEKEVTDCRRLISNFFKDIISWKKRR